MEDKNITLELQPCDELIEVKTRKQYMMECRQLLAGEKNIVLAIHMPDDSVELIINQNVQAKLDYIEKAYDDDLLLKTNNDIYIVDYMIY